TIFIGAQKVCSASTACVFDERAAHEELSKAESRVIVQLGRGRARLDFLTTDLTTDYVRINADYST
ncbi:MAG: bifunctional glutamate N-acetyltransferase/amino-acid acetyltransferase ArgJ, partial [Acidobacteria bacterium]